MTNQIELKQPGRKSGVGGGGLTSTGSVRQQHVPVETVALVTPVSVHAPVFAGPWLQPTLVQICGGETETESGHGQTDRQKEGEGASYRGSK